MASLPHIVAYLAVGVFLLAVAARVIMWLRMPMHLRWELYPVAHEASRAHYGGSYLEESEWWKKPRENSLVGELKVMVPEILFLVALKEHNPRLWARSFPFHFGLYLVIACTVLMGVAGVGALIVPGLLGGVLGDLLRYAIIGTGWAGLGLSLLGGLGLLQRRLSDPELQDFTTPADILNLLLFVVAFGVALAHAVVLDPAFTLTTAFVASLVGVSVGQAPQTFTTVTVVLLGLLVAYIPLTHMSHFVGKYFAYHAIRWNDTPNLRGGNQEATIGRLLNQPLTWSAPHIQGNGTKTWAQAATEEMKK